MRKRTLGDYFYIIENASYDIKTLRGIALRWIADLHSGNMSCKHDALLTAH